MRIATRLRIVSGATIVALIILAPILVRSVLEFRSAKNNYALAEAIKLNTFERASFRDQYFLYREDRARMQWDKSKETAERLVRQAEAQLHGKNPQQLERLHNDLADSAVIFHRIVNNTERLKMAGSSRSIYEELDKRLSSQLLLKAAAIRDTATALQDASARHVEQTYQDLIIIVGLFAATLSLTTILTAIHLGRLIRKRLAPLHDGARIIADGDLDYRIKCDGIDEFCDLSMSINTMTDKLQAFTRQLEDEISAHKKVEVQISELNRDFISFLENTSDFIYFKDENSRFRFCSQTLANITGHASWRDMIGKHDLEVFPNETAQIYYNEELPIFSEGKPLLNKVNPFFDASGNKGWVSSNKWPLLDQEGKVVGLFGISRDITEVKRAEEELHESEARFRNFFEKNSSVMLLIDPASGAIIAANMAAAAYYGYPRERLIGTSINKINLLAPERVAEERQRAVREERNYFIFQHRLATGEVRDVEVYSTPFESSGHALLLSIVHDITKRKQAEEKLRLSASVFTHAREGITITSADAKIIEVNDAFTRITGYSRDEVLGQNPRILSSGRQGKEYYAAMWRDLVEKGHWYGEIWNRRKDGEVYAEMLTISAVRDEQGITRQYVALFSDITPFKEHEKQLEHIAHYDALTSLPNRVLLADRLYQAMTQAQRRGQRLAVAYLDLDGFKAINDSYGHDAGDLLLMTVAARMKQSLRDGDTLARLGGDEFVAVLLDLVDIEASVPMLTRLLTAAAQPVLVGDLALQVSASLGVTFYPQSDDVDADQLLRQADQAMYQAKLAGKNCYNVFDTEQDRSIRGLHESLEHIRHALTEREFVLYYQPKVNMRTGAVVGAEALIRWQHPEKGLLPPAVFLPVIENHPLAVELGEWVIESALKQMDIWHAGGLEIPVSVNVGARQLLQINFVEHLKTSLEAHPNIKPGDLELEVLETSALEDLVRVSQVIAACQEIGVMFALDDFGTGYSSLTYLKHLPVTLLKIDQSFVRDMLEDPDDLAILEGVIGLSTAFRRQVIAEGVETVAHGEMLLRLGCVLAQGYGIGRPMPAHLLPSWLAAWRPDPAWADLPALSRDDLPLLFAGVEHRAWILAIESYLAGEKESLPPLDHHQCRFGRWLEGGGLARHGAQPAFQSIEPLHRQVHDLTKELLKLRARGRLSEALARLGELHELRDAMLERLDALIQESAQ